MTFLLSSLQISYVLGFFSLFAVGTYGMTLNELCMLAILGYTVVQTVWYGRPLRFPMRPSVIAAVGLWFAFAVSAFVVALRGEHAFVAQAAKTFAHFTMIWVASMAIISLPIKAEQWVMVLRVNLIIAGVVCLYGVYQVPARTFGLPLGWIEISNASFARGAIDGADTNQLALRFANFFRATSIFSEPSALSGYAASSLLLLVIPLFRGGRAFFKSRIVTWIMITLMLLAILLAFSLTGVMIVFACGIMAAILFGKRAITPMLYTLIIAACVMASANYVVLLTTDFDVLGTYSARITSVASGKAASNLEADNLSGESYQQRSSDYEYSFLVWAENPVFGTGPGCFSRSDIGKKHNSPFVSTAYGSVLAEEGIVGIVAFVSMYLLMFISFTRDYLQWDKLKSDQGSIRALLAPYLPFKMLQLILISFTGNTLISAATWTDLTLLIGSQTLIRETLGTNKYQSIQLVQVAWRDRVITWLQKGNRIGTDS